MQTTDCLKFVACYYFCLFLSHPRLIYGLAILQMVESIGGRLVENVDEASSATHVIAGDGKIPLRRTPKLMICICCTSNILNMSWLIDSAKYRQPLDCGGYLLLNDNNAEKAYNFCMHDTLENGHRIRSRRGGLLVGWSVLFVKGVAGNKAPPANELSLIIDAAGGDSLKSLSLRETRGIDPTKIIIITSDPATEAQTSAKDVTRLSFLGAALFTTSWLFHCMITQKLHVLEEEDELKTEVASMGLEHTPSPSRERKRRAGQIPDSARRSSRLKS